MRAKIFSDMIDAMKNKEKERLSVIRMLKGAIQNKGLDTKRELNDVEVIELLVKEIKTRKNQLNNFKRKS